MADNRAKLDQARALKDEGNELFKQQQFGKAKVKYATAIAYTKAITGRTLKGSDPMAAMASQSVHKEKIDPEVETAADELDAVLKTNLSTCFLKLNKPQDALAYAQQAIAHNPNHWKAELRAAEAKEALRDFDGCLKILEALFAKTDLQSDTGAQTSFRKLREKAMKGVKEQNAKQRKAFSNLFDRARGDEKAAATPAAAAVAAPAPASATGSSAATATTAEATSAESSAEMET